MSTSPEMPGPTLGRCRQCLLALQARLTGTSSAASWQVMLSLLQMDAGLMRPGLGGWGQGGHHLHSQFGPRWSGWGWWGPQPRANQCQHVQEGSGRAPDWESEDQGLLQARHGSGGQPWGCSHRLLQAGSSCGSLSHGRGLGTGCRSLWCFCSSFFQEQPQVSLGSTLPYSQPCALKPKGRHLGGLTSQCNSSFHHSGVFSHGHMV